MGGGTMKACILCDKLPVVYRLPDCWKSEETGHLNPLTCSKVGRDSDFCFRAAVARVRTSLASAFISAVSKVNISFYCTFSHPGLQSASQAANVSIQRQKHINA